MKIGIAIPCHKEHAHHILPLLENISKSTVLPDHIVISCSSWTLDFESSFLYNSIPVTILYTISVLNAAQNRNRAAKYLQTDYISFFDIDDRMHPTRIQRVVEGLQLYEAIYHSYVRVSTHTNTEWDALEPNLIEGIETDPTIWGLKIHEYPLHHAHVSLRREVFLNFQFDESSEHYRREDSVYGKTLYLSGVTLGFFTNPLSQYLFHES